MIRALLAEQRSRPRNITTGRSAICGGDTVPIPLQQDYAATFGHPMVEGFGMTEGLPTLANHPDNNRPGSMGRPLGDVEIRAVDGELWMRGSGIATGYWGHPPFEDGWLKTGDLVEIDPDGFVWFRGRKKEIIVRGGSNICAAGSGRDVCTSTPPWAKPASSASRTNTGAKWFSRSWLCAKATRLTPGGTDRLRAPASGRIQMSGADPVSSRAPKGATGKVQRRALKDLRIGSGSFLDADVSFLGFLRGAPTPPERGNDGAPDIREIRVRQRRTLRLRIDRRNHGADQPDRRAELGAGKDDAAAAR